MHKHIQSHSLNFTLSFGYSLIIHAVFGLVILYSFQVNPLMNRPPEDYLIVKLTRETEIPVKSKDKDIIESKERKPIPPEIEPPPVIEEQTQPVLEQIPESAEPKPQEITPPFPEEPKPLLPLEEPVIPPPVEEVAPSKPLVEEVEVELPIPEPPPLVAEAIVNEPAFTEPEPPPFFPETPPMVNQPVIPLPEPELVLPLEESITPPPVEEIVPPEPLLEEVELELPIPEPPPLVAELEEALTEPGPLPFQPELPPMINLPLLPVPETEPLPMIAKADEIEQEFIEPELPLFPRDLPPMVNLPIIPPGGEEPDLFSETFDLDTEQDQLEQELQYLIEEFALEESGFITPTAPMIVVTEPRNGAVVNVTRHKTITVRGTINDTDVDTATVILNGNRVEVEVHEGQFETLLSGIADENTLIVEATNEAGMMGQSALIHFSTIHPDLKDIQVVLSRKASCSDIRLTALEGLHPQSRNYRPFKPPIKIKDSTVDYDNDSPYLAKLMTVQKSRSSVYTIRLDAHPSRSISECDPHLVIILYGYDSERVRTKVFHHSSISDPGEGPWISAKFLMPQGFFWDDDDWTTGQIEDSRSRTKFNTSLGIVWKELK